MTTRTGNTPYTGTFANMSQLKEITLPASCSQFGVKDWTLNTDLSTSRTFANCTSLKNLNFKNFTLKTTSSTAFPTLPLGIFISMMTGSFNGLCSMTPPVIGTQFKN